MKILLILFLLILSTQVLAFDQVSEILPSGKILICKNSSEVINGDVVEVYAKSINSGRFDKSTKKIAQFTLPAAGKRIQLSRNIFSNKKIGVHVKTVQVGTAIISVDSLEGEKRLIYSIGKSHTANINEKLITISKEDAQKIQSECLVAIPENGLKVQEKLSVLW